MHLCLNESDTVTIVIMSSLLGIITLMVAGALHATWDTDPAPQDQTYRVYRVSFSVLTTIRGVVTKIFAKYNVLLSSPRDTPLRSASEA